MGPTLCFDTKQRNSFFWSNLAFFTIKTRFWQYYSEFIVKKSHLNDEFLVLLGPIISRLFTCSNEEKNKQKQQGVLALVLSLCIRLWSWYSHWCWYSIIRSHLSKSWISFTSCQCRQAGRRLRVFRGMRAPNKSDSFVAISVGWGTNLIKLFTPVIYEWIRNKFEWAFPVLA